MRELETINDQVHVILWAEYSVHVPPFQAIYPFSCNICLCEKKKNPGKKANFHYRILLFH